MVHTNPAEAGSTLESGRKKKADTNDEQTDGTAQGASRNNVHGEIPRHITERHGEFRDLGIWIYKVAHLGFDPRMQGRASSLQGTPASQPIHGQ